MEKPGEMAVTIFNQCNEELASRIQGFSLDNFEKLDFSQFFGLFELNK